MSCSGKKRGGGGKKPEMLPQAAEMQMWSQTITGSAGLSDQEISVGPEGKHFSLSRLTAFSFGFSSISRVGVRLEKKNHSRDKGPEVAGP